MEPFDALAALGMASVAITVAAARGGCDGLFWDRVGNANGAAAVTPVLAVIAALATAAST